MYTIFINEVPIFLTNNIGNKSKYFLLYKNKTTIKFLLDKIKNGNIKEVYLYYASLDMLWKAFKDYFKIEKSAGGLIKNKENETLFIYRLKKWDLPKGKIEKGEGVEEAAIREVEEECGITNLSINKQLSDTFHIYPLKGKLVLKQTYWFDMTSSHKDKLVPQLEENITKAEWLTDADVNEKVLKNTYTSI
ncbi:MAG: NUDIX domain-containing protein, partial [Flavobacteriaceae bacterium]|nr:NUDIX domain-containing protein [Flavobacteriaceae bacterium]